MLSNWNNAKAAALREFLNTSVGQDVLSDLAEAADAVPPGKGFEEEALNGRYAKGLRMARKSIIDASNYSEPAQAERPDIDIESILSKNREIAVD